MGDNGITNPSNAANHNNNNTSASAANVNLNVAPNVTIDDPDSINLQHKFNSSLLCATTPNAAPPTPNLHPSLYHSTSAATAAAAAANPSFFYPSNHTAAASHWAISTSSAPSSAAAGYQSALDLHHAFDYAQFGTTPGGANSTSSYHTNGIQYGSESQFLGYRNDTYGIVTDPSVLGYGVNKGSQYTSGAHRYSQHNVVPPSYQYPDTQLLHPSFANVPDSVSNNLQASNDQRLTPSGSQVLYCNISIIGCSIVDAKFVCRFCKKEDKIKFKNLVQY